MDHVAIMRKSWGLTEKILSGEKKIESRWYKNKSKPWDFIKTGDRVYFKDSGCPVSIKAEVRRVVQFRDLTPPRSESILDTYGKATGISEADTPKYCRLFKDKKYCILIFLKDPKKVKPFDINKKGFGAMAAWISVSDISLIRRR